MTKEDWWMVVFILSPIWVFAFIYVVSRLTGITP